MDFIIYTLLAIISMFLISLGYFLKNNADFLKLAGFSILFLLGIVLIPSIPPSLNYVSGSDVVIDGSNYTITDTYSSYTDLTFGFIISVIAMFGFSNVYFTRRDNKYEE